MKKDRRDVDTSSSLSMMLLVFNCNEDIVDGCGFGVGFEKALHNDIGDNTKQKAMRSRAW